MGQRWVLSLSNVQLERLVELLERRNTNRRMASLAQMIIAIVLHVVPPSKLVAVEGMNATCSAVLSYSSRHMARVESLLQKTFLFDLALQSSSQGLALQDESELAQGDKREPSTGGASAEAALKSTMEVLLGPIEEEH